MWKHFEAGLISFICCVVLGIVLAVGNPTQFSQGRVTPDRPAEEVTPQKPLVPVIPKFKLASDLPTLTPQETRTIDTDPIPNFQTASLDEDVSLNDWESKWDNTWDDLSYSISPAGKQYRIEIDPSNYGDRQPYDAHGKPAQNEILVVLHETTSAAESAIHLFQTHHPKDADQVSYHALILLDGRIIHLVPPEKRAYGAGNSEFKSDRGIEAVQTNPKYPSSVNNFAYHISLETPVDAQGKDVETHSGYSVEQYESLAWLIQQLQVPANRVTTHREVDRNHDRTDPRSFDMEYLAAFLY